jgi:hypothetical protein
VTIISFDKDNIGLSIPNSNVFSFDATHWEITEEEWNADTVHTLNNIAIIAQVSGSVEPVAIVIDNPIAEKDTTFTLKDKGEAASKWVFKAYYNESVGFDTPPWRIFWPK